LGSRAYILAEKYLDLKPDGLYARTIGTKYDLMPHEYGVEIFSGREEQEIIHYIWVKDSDTSWSSMITRSKREKLGLHSLLLISREAHPDMYVSTEPKKADKFYLRLPALIPLVNVEEISAEEVVSTSIIIPKPNIAVQLMEKDREEIYKEIWKRIMEVFHG
jgi:hypothetical protein